MTSQIIDCEALIPSNYRDDVIDLSPLNTMAKGLGGSKILKIAGEIRAMQAAGRDVCNLTVGDFKPSQFRVPPELTTEITAALERGETNYPPAVGLPETREAVRNLYERELGLNYPADSVIMGSGARPPIYATFKLLVEPGDVVLYGLPSWNVGYYVYLSGARGQGIPTRAENDFLLDAGEIAANLNGVTLVILNSPMNPCGTAFSAEKLGRICDVILSENNRRRATGARPVMVLYDQVYWMLTFGETKHHTPISVRPEMAPYTIFVDAISKSFAATGLRVGWGVVPPPLANAYKALIGHMGAWAPRPEQIATAALLNNPEAITQYHSTMKTDCETRLRTLHDGFEAMAARGLPVKSMAPQGAIYLSVNFPIHGRHCDGKPLRTDEDIRFFLLDKAGFGVVPFGAFGVPGDLGWMRLSIGAVSVADIKAGLARIADALEKLT
jgi:aspartate aminotransferase